MKLADEGPSGSVRLLPTRTTRLVAICGKCGRKIGGGFGPRGDKALAKVLRRAVEAAKGKKAPLRIVETRCLNICPKRAVAIVDSRAPGRVTVVPSGASVEAIAASLDLLVRDGSA